MTPPRPIQHLCGGRQWVRPASCVGWRLAVILNHYHEVTSFLLAARARPNTHLNFPCWIFKLKPERSCYSVWQLWWWRGILSCCPPIVTPGPAHNQSVSTGSGRDNNQHHCSSAGGIKTAYYRDLINTSARQFVKRVIVFSFYSFLKKKKTVCRKLCSLRSLFRRRVLMNNYFHSFSSKMFCLGREPFLLLELRRLILMLLPSLRS